MTIIDVPPSIDAQGIKSIHHFIADLEAPATDPGPDCGHAVDRPRPVRAPHLADRLASYVEGGSLPASMDCGDRAIFPVGNEYRHTVGRADVTDEP